MRPTAPPPALTEYRKMWPETDDAVDFVVDCGATDLEERALACFAGRDLAFVVDFDGRDAGTDVVFVAADVRSVCSIVLGVVLLGLARAP